VEAFFNKELADRMRPGRAGGLYIRLLCTSVGDYFSAVFPDLAPLHNVIDVGFQSISLASSTGVVYCDGTPGVRANHGETRGGGGAHDHLHLELAAPRAVGLCTLESS
jgi:hypothetical protein